MLRTLEETVETIAAIMTNPARDVTERRDSARTPPDTIQERRARNDNALARRASAGTPAIAAGVST
jgi:hypothetical protein